MRTFLYVAGVGILLLIGYNVGREAGYDKAFSQCEADSEKILRDHEHNSWLRKK